MKRRLNSMMAFLIFLVFPAGLGIFQWVRYHQETSGNRAWAESQLQTAHPDPRAYSILGSALMSQGRLDQALPVLRQACRLEDKAGSSATDHINLAQADLLGLAHGLTQASRSEGLEALQRAGSLAGKLSKGPAAAAYYECGKLYLEWGLRPQAVDQLRKACALQKDDWVDMGKGQGYRFQGLANTYIKELLIASEGSK